MSICKFEIFFVAFSALTCVPLKIPPRALLLNGTCGDTYGSNCVFGCQSGYVKADGNVTRTCLQTGQWSGNPIYCIGTQREFINQKKKDEIVSFCILAYCQNMHHRIGSSNVTELIKIKRQFLSVFFITFFFSDLVYSRITLAGVCIVLVSSFDSLPHHCRSNMANSYSKFLRNSEEIRLTVHCNKPPLKFCSLKA